MDRGGHESPVAHGGIGQIVDVGFVSVGKGVKVAETVVDDDSVFVNVATHRQVGHLEVGVVYVTLDPGGQSVAQAGMAHGLVVSRAPMSVAEDAVRTRKNEDINIIGIRLAVCVVHILNWRPLLGRIGTQDIRCLSIPNLVTSTVGDKYTH